MVEHHMWGVCENPEALFHSSPDSTTAIAAGGSHWPFQIHSSCEELLTVLTIVTAPLSLLYRFVHTDNISFSRYIYLRKNKKQHCCKILCDNSLVSRVMDKRK